MVPDPHSVQRRAGNQPPAPARTFRAAGHLCLRDLAGAGEPGCVGAGWNGDNFPSSVGQPAFVRRGRCEAGRRTPVVRRQVTSWPVRLPSEQQSTTQLPFHSINLLHGIRSSNVWSCRPVSSQSDGQVWVPSYRYLAGPGALSLKTAGPGPHSNPGLQSRCWRHVSTAPDRRARPLQEHFTGSERAATWLRGQEHGAHDSLVRCCPSIRSTE